MKGKNKKKTNLFVDCESKLKYWICEDFKLDTCYFFIYSLYVRYVNDC